MIRSLSLSAALLAIVLFISTGSMSARTRETVVTNLGSTNQLNALTLAVNPSQILTIWANLLYTGGGDGYHDNDKDKDKDKDEDKDEDKDKDKNHGPSPVPEPSTIMSFGAALLIGGGMLYSQRLRRNRK